MVVVLVAMLVAVAMVDEVVNSGIPGWNEGRVGLKKRVYSNCSVRLKMQE